MTVMHPFRADRVWLAPMSGATDAPFRRQALRFGAPAVVSEMVAGEALNAARRDMVRRTLRHEGPGQWIVQIAGRRPEDMHTATQILCDAGVDVVDINMGCPAKQVTGGSSGSALMREPDLASRLIEAVLDAAGSVPVTLKMRLGWDGSSFNAPEIGRRAQALGIAMLTVHGRTRCQFYTGRADWARVGDTVAAVNVPVLVNGDIACIEDAQSALAQSGAHGVMVGRAAMGRPWLVGQIAAALDGGAYRPPTLAEQGESLCQQIDDSLRLYGNELGLRMVRKHVSAAIEHIDLPLTVAVRRTLRAELCRIERPSVLVQRLSRLFSDHTLEVAV